ncbi:MAG TPA: alpha-galactosidase [Microthrixaceae bacterium]|nr:alpha-galactosidase [Microthrixaceae bacterium]
MAEARPDDVIRIDSGGWGLSWAPSADGTLHQVGLGPAGAAATRDVAAHWYPRAFPTPDGTDPFRPPALHVVHADGTLSTRLVLDDVDRSDAADGSGEHVVLTTVDELFDLTVEHHLLTHPDSGVLEQWVEVVHAEDGPVTLLSHDSIAPFLMVPGDAEYVQFGGAGWADEWRWSTGRPVIGTTVLGSLGGVQPHLQRSPCLLLSPTGPFDVDAEGAPVQDRGEVIGLSVAWGGNSHVSLDLRPRAEPGAPGELRVRAGAHALGAPYRLDPGARMVLPTVAWVWSSAGRDGVTEAFHRWSRARVLRDADRRRPLVVNNWEATYFDFDEHRIVGLIDRAAGLGADVFLLDDGWFGTTRPRDDDTQGLGDWDVDRRKLPGGLGPLTDAAAERGIRFGIWVEPEMVNPLSDLYDDHPEWVARDVREPREHRQQLYLDPLRPEVRDFEVDVVGRTLRSAPGTSYVKWDANRPVTDPGSATLPADRQANVWFDQVGATWEVMARVAAAHPDVELMLCASGGGRVDHGSLRWFHEFWTSDNTDPVARVRMQWACSHFFPGAVMAAHVTRWGERPMAFASAVALSGRFGIDLDLESTTRAEDDVLGRAVEWARRTQDVVQQGTVRRYVSPVDGADRSRAAFSVTLGDRTVVFAYQLEESTSTPPVIPLRGLPRAGTYRIRSTDLHGPAEETTSAADELDRGIEWPLDRPLSARLWEIEPTRRTA